MSGLAIIIDRAGTGELLTPLHSAGLTDYTARYYVSADTAPAKLPDRVAGDHLTAAATTGLSVNTAGTRAHLSAVGGATLTGTALRGTPVSFAAVIRTSGIGTKLTIGGYSLAVAQTGVWYLAGDPNGGGSILQARSPKSDVWSLVIGVGNLASSALQVEESSYIASGSITAAAAPRTSKLHSHSTISTDVRELIVWNRALSASDRTTVRTAMKAHHTDLP